jgi:hypothetical protein
LAHLKSIPKTKLALLKSALDWNSTPYCKKGRGASRFEKGDIVEYRRPDYVSKIVKVVSETKTHFLVEDDYGKYSVSSSELFLISEM